MQARVVLCHRSLFYRLVAGGENAGYLAIFWDDVHAAYYLTVNYRDDDDDINQKSGSAKANKAR